MPKKDGDIPDVNDLVRVSQMGVVDVDDSGVANDVASRIEDVDRDGKTGRISGYQIAVPRFSGDVILPEPQTRYSLNWHTPSGLWMLPTAFQAQETTGYGLRVWRLQIAGAPQRDQRRQYVRVPWSLPADLEVRHDLSALDDDRQRMLEHHGIPDRLAALPQGLEARAVNLSEGGLLCMTLGPMLPAYLPLITRFTLDSVRFEIPASVVWSVARDGKAQMAVENALSFDDPGLEGDKLRPLLFQAQLRARRAGLV
jgi:hypothetical protein